jgi:hypothetical protein
VHSRAVMCLITPDSASLPRWAPTLPRARQHRTQPPCRSELLRCHVSSGSRPHLPTEVDSGTTMCPEAPTSLPSWNGLRCRRVSYNSGPCLHVREGFGATTCLTVPNRSHAS